MSADWSQVPAAVLDEAGVLEHVGSPLREQRILRDGLAIVPRADRRVLAVPGEDRLSWLDSISTQALKTLAPGESSELLVLDPQGHVEHAASVLDDGETTWLIVDAADAEPLLTFLLRMRFRLRVTPRDASDELAVIGCRAPALAHLEAASPAGVPLVWRDLWPEIGIGGVGYAADEDHPGHGYGAMEVLVTRETEAALVRAAAAGEIAVAGVLAAEALRIAAWRPRWAAEIDERTIPHELDWLRTAVHLDKGCYRGQETVAKVHNLGHPPRRLVSVQLDGSDAVLPAAGAEVRVGDAVVGRLTSVAQHVDDGPIGLAVVSRRADVATPATVDTPDGPVAAALIEIVPPDAGAAASVPRLTRLSRRT
ncbi:MAG: folate-binding protein [Microbacterium sp.]|uniref:Aminomethyltransferase n=2 Tax=Microbacterium ginsengisoli TaxID=400772 RepID=A0A0F0LWR5_9MICO|nr:folate-binding protein YgfZ [Microbacterium ginsengisoli]KJL38276.1 Aminomethyltransferase [Microbacterium ginsengisoli]MAL05289.1 folate-binding protein [Microbacterium sp.]MBN9209640.1 folate-binding protein YgfZ [Microbacterium ginsengisoli]